MVTALLRQKHMAEQSPTDGGFPVKNRVQERGLTATCDFGNRGTYRSLTDAECHGAESAIVGHGLR